MRFRTTILAGGGTTTGIEVPADVPAVARRHEGRGQRCTERPPGSS